MGDFEDAMKVHTAIQDQDLGLDSNMQNSMLNAFNQVSTQQQKYITHNKQGIAKFSEGQYSEAYASFSEAKPHCPASKRNTQFALQFAK
jgi:hypothetical protein